MKITEIKTRKVKHYLFVQVYTDAGIVGLGEAGNWAQLNATEAAIHKFGEYLIGKDRPPEHFRQLVLFLFPKDNLTYRLVILRAI